MKTAITLFGGIVIGIVGTLGAGYLAYKKFTNEISA